MIRLISPVSRRHRHKFALLLQTIPRHVLLKSVGTTLFLGLFFSAYFYLLKTPAYPTTVMPLTWPPANMWRSTCWPASRWAC